MSTIEQDVERARDAPAVPDRSMGWLLVLGGLLGLAASGMLTYEKLRLENDPSYAPSCNFTSVVNCGDVMSSKQAVVLGFPNSFLGIGAFAVLVMIGIALLAGVVLDTWFWAGLQVGATLGVLAVAWLISQSLYEIGALCPYCMVVWVVTIPIFWITTVRNLSTRPGFASSPVGGVLIRHTILPIIAAYLVVGLLIFLRFG